MTWQEIEKAAASDWRPVSGGFTAAKRGLVTMTDGTKLFMKQAVDEQTHDWLRQELRVYRWLQKHDFKHMLPIVAEASDASGLALADISDWDWEAAWDVPKVDAVLKALDGLAGLSEAAKADFEHLDFAGSMYLAQPNEASVYAEITDDAEVLDELNVMLHDQALREEYEWLTRTEPWSGNDLVHYDARSDNFAFNRTKGEGVLVDWNWAGLGNRRFDQTSLLINVQLAGFDVLEHYKDRLDKASLAWLMIFWLRNATGPRDTEGLKRLRPQQIKSAIVAHRLAARL